MTSPKPILLLVSGTAQSGKSTWVGELGPVQVKYAWEYLGGPNSGDILTRLNSSLHKNTKGRVPHVVVTCLRAIDYAGALGTLGIKGDAFPTFEHLKHLPFDRWPFKYRQLVPKLFLEDDVAGRRRFTLQDLYNQHPMPALSSFTEILKAFPGPPELFICDDFQPDHLEPITSQLQAKGWDYDIYHVYVTHSGDVGVEPSQPPDLIVTTAGMATKVVEEVKSKWGSVPPYTVV